jgi:hypothetical protein
MHAEGAAKVVFAWPAFWCLEHYKGLSEYLNASCRLIHADDDIIVYQLY